MLEFSISGNIKREIFVKSFPANSHYQRVSISSTLFRFQLRANSRVNLDELFPLVNMRKMVCVVFLYPTN